MVGRENKSTDRTGMPTSLLVDMLHIISIVCSVHVSDFAYCLSMLTAFGARPGLHRQH